MPMPVTIWLARSVMLSQACSRATGSTATTPIASPSSGLPGGPGADRAAEGADQHHALDAHVEHAGALADQLAGAPRAAAASPGAGSSRRRPRAISSVIVVPPCALSIQKAVPASIRMIRPWITSTTALGTPASISMLMPPERRKPNSSARGQHAGDRAAREQADDEAVEAVARREARLQAALVALQHEGAGEPAERAGEEQHQHDRRRDAHAGAPRGDRVQADRAQAQAQHACGRGRWRRRARARARSAARRAAACRRRR